MLMFINKMAFILLKQCLNTIPTGGRQRLYWGWGARPHVPPPTGFSPTLL